MNWFRGFFENGQPQSMSDLLALLVSFGGLVYCFTHSDAISGAAIITLGLGLKGHKNYESRKREK